MALTLFIICYPTKDSFFMICSAAIHELGHLLAVKMCNISPRGFYIGLCGGDMQINSSSSYTSDICVYLGGIFANAVMLCIFYKTAFGYHNASYALLNALPISELDGGKALRSALSCFLNPYTADRVCSYVSYAALFIVWQLGIYLFFKTSSNLTLLIFCVYLFTVPEKHR